ncbi:right-handed parallel beta-helix repeat-containing protein [Alteromonas stellipolaris]|nr:right-handed parallel beta-helix repeat-containing protein [Alteromonas stellipolaris]
MNNNTAQSNLVAALNEIPNKTSVRGLATENAYTISELYSADILAIVINGGLNKSTLATKFKNLPNTAKAVDVLVLLFPIDAYRLLAYALENEVIESSTMLAIAAKNKLDPTVLLAATASGLDNSITPLIHSAGIVLYGQDEDSINEVRYRAVDSSAWLPALELAWEPIYGALSGSIVHLQPETDYEVEILVTDYEGTTELYSFDFETRPNSPPIDPEKIYYLSAIYSGGQLDLEALNIQGSEDGYAKVIGDGIVIEAGDNYLSAINIGSQAYIMLENLTVRGGQRYGIFAEKTHHIWIKGCNVSEYGNVANDYRNGIGYKTTESTSPINYDAGIYLEKTGVSVIEECEIHSPNGKANHWGYGHPKGPNALQVWAYHPDEMYRGQMIVRNNRFYGTSSHRFNDVIEGRKNFERTGGFVRDSAIYGNYLAFANDDLIEIDGGQSNVLVYENELTQGYAGVSIAPNMLGPSYVFHNYIHDLGDEIGKEWTAIKAGGLLSKPGGKTFILENYIVTNRNGIASSRVNNDSTFWVLLQNNMIITKNKNNLVGYAVYDKEKFFNSTFINNIFYNKKSELPLLDLSFSNLTEHPLTKDSDFIASIPEGTFAEMPSSTQFLIDNFSRVMNTPEIISPNAQGINLKSSDLSAFDNQTKYGEARVIDNKTIVLTGNGWYKLPIETDINLNTTISFDISIMGEAEIVGIALETDNSLSQSNVFKIKGTQDYGNDISYQLNNGETTHVEIELGRYDIVEVNYIVFILDNDIKEHLNDTNVTFDNINFSNHDALIQDVKDETLRIGK